MGRPLAQSQEVVGVPNFPVCVKGTSSRNETDFSQWSPIHQQPCSMLLDFLTRRMTCRAHLLGKKAKRGLRKHSRRNLMHHESREDTSSMTGYSLWSPIHPQPGRMLLDFLTKMIKRRAHLLGQKSCRGFTTIRKQ